MGQKRMFFSNVDYWGKDMSLGLGLDMDGYRAFFGFCMSYRVDCYDTTRF